MDPFFFGSRIDEFILQMLINAEIVFFLLRSVTTNAMRFDERCDDLLKANYVRSGGLAASVKPSDIINIAASDVAKRQQEEPSSD